jgi:hypothetical protein
MNQITGALRVVLPAVLAYAAGRGWLSPSQVGPFTDVLIGAVPLIVTGAAAVWSIYAWAKNNLIRHVAADPRVREVVTDHNTANVGALKDVSNVISRGP